MTPKQRTFVQEYLIDMNATQAAIRTGYSERTARQQGQRLLTNVVITAAIEEAKQERAQRTEITQDYVLTTIRDETERCKMGTAEQYPGVFKGAELLARHLGMFDDKLDLKGAAPVQYVVLFPKD